MTTFIPNICLRIYLNVLSFQIIFFYVAKIRIKLALLYHGKTGFFERRLKIMEKQELIWQEYSLNL